MVHRRHPRPPRRPAAPGRFRGVTLIELLIVVALLGIAGALLIPNMSHVGDFTLEASARRVVSDLNFAQSDAMARQSPRRVLFDAEGTGYRVLEPPYDPEEDVLSDPLSWDGTGTYAIDFTNDPRFDGISVETTIPGDASFITYDEVGGPVDESGSPLGRSEIVLVHPRGDRAVIAVAAFTGQISVTIERAE